VIEERQIKKKGTGPFFMGLSLFFKKGACPLFSPFFREFVREESLRACVAISCVSLRACVVISCVSLRACVAIP